jgi:hypothetical protein
MSTNHDEEVKRERTISYKRLALIGTALAAAFAASLAFLPRSIPRRLESIPPKPRATPVQTVLFTPTPAPALPTPREEPPPRLPNNRPVDPPPKNDEAKETKKAQAPAALATGIKGDGPDSGLVGAGTGLGGGSRIGFGGPGGGGLGYRRSIAANLKSFLERNPKTKSGVFAAKVSLWIDSTGKVTRVESAEPAIVAAATGLQLPPPPDGTKMPILFQIGARRPTASL